MFRTEKTVGMLKAIAMIAGLAILLWSLGLPSLSLADAANITDVSDTLSDSAPSVGSNHTIRFNAPTEDIDGAEEIVITFPAGFDLSTIGQEDIDLLEGGVNQAAAGWTVGTTSNTITLTMAGETILADATTTILIGTHAVNEGSPNSQIINPGSEGSKEINIAAGPQDTGTTHVVILESVTVQAAVDTVFTFAVSGLPSGTTVNGDTTTGSTSSTTISFGTLSNGSATTSAQRLSVSTNASNGYVVTVQVDQALQSSKGADIDGFVNGSDTNTPATWSSPSGTLGSENTYGHWGFTSDDATTTRDAGDEFGPSEYAAASTSPRVVMSHTGPVNGAGVGLGTTTVGYKIEITSLQEAGDDYTATLTYVATPTF